MKFDLYYCCCPLHARAWPAPGPAAALSGIHIISTLDINDCSPGCFFWMLPFTSSTYYPPFPRSDVLVASWSFLADTHSCLQCCVMCLRGLEVDKSSLLVRRALPLNDVMKTKKYFNHILKELYAFL